MSFVWPNSPEPPCSRAPMSSILWHYTGPDGLLGILSSNRFWASDPIAMNDQRELKYGLDVIVEEWEDMRSSVASEAELTELIDELLSEAWQTKLLESVFIVSASTSPEIAAQWLTYASGSGFAIGFEHAHLWWPIPAGDDYFRGDDITQVPVVAPTWLTIDYERSEQGRTARDLIGSSLEVMRGTAARRNAIDMLRMNIATGVASFKHHAFSAESEARLPVPKVGQRVKFRSSPGRLIPYTEVACYVPEPESNRGRARSLPIREIVCAASSSDAVMATVRRLLVECAYTDVEVKRSELPLS